MSASCEVPKVQSWRYYWPLQYKSWTTQTVQRKVHRNRESTHGRTSPEEEKDLWNYIQKWSWWTVHWNHLGTLLRQTGCLTRRRYYRWPLVQAKRRKCLQRVVPCQRPSGPFRKGGSGLMHAAVRTWEEPIRGSSSINASKGTRDNQIRLLWYNLWLDEGHKYWEKTSFSSQPHKHSTKCPIKSTL